jgi:type I restriction enzyme R subunit
VIVDLPADRLPLVRFAIRQDGGPGPSVPFNARFNGWLVGAASGRDRAFTLGQIRWLEMIRDHIAANLGIEPDDFEYAPFSQHGGLGKVDQLFGDKLNTIIEELNEMLAA